MCILFAWKTNRPNMTARPLKLATANKLNIFITHRVHNTL